jgi:uncharacterized ion transporter superfamily protein YfcC
MSSDPPSEELTDPFVRAMKRAVEPADVWTARGVWAIRLLGFAGMVYSATSFGGWSQPAGTALFFGSLVVVLICGVLKKLSDRVERLESDVMLRDLGSRKGPDRSDPKD